MSTLYTLDEIKQFSDEEVVERIFDRAMQVLYSSEKNSGLSKLPIGYQTIASILITQGEIDNGGFYQYFGNSTAEEYSSFAISSYKRIGAFAVVDILEKVWSQITKSKTFLAKYKRVGIQDAFNEANEQGEIEIDETLEDKFYNLEKEVQTLLVRYIRQNNISFG